MDLIVRHKLYGSVRKHSQERCRMPLKQSSHATALIDILSCIISPTLRPQEMSIGKSANQMRWSCAYLYIFENLGWRLEAVP